MAELRVDQIDVSFGGVHALHHLSLEVEAGSVTGLIGPNGAGKTTLFNVITGLQKPSRGRVMVGGSDVTRLAPHRRSRLGLARTFQRLEIFGSLSARENIQVAAEIRRGWARKGDDDPVRTAEAILARVGLSEVAGDKADTLPTGMGRLVELGRALATEPRLLLLDEPSSGLDQDETSTLGDLLVDLASSGMAVLLVEHDVDLVMRVCSVVHVLDFGEIIAVGTPDEVRADPHVQMAYLGSEAPASSGSSPKHL